MAKRGSPALYELIRARGHEPAAPPPPPTGHIHAGSPAASGEPLPGGWLRPGRTLRVPIGYIFAVAAIGIVLVAIAYMAGHVRGTAEARILLHDEAEHLLSGPATTQIPRDPLETASKATSTPPPASHSGPRTQSRSPRQWGPIESDPRERGLNYLMLVTTNRAGAERVANFAREHGLETYLIPTNNPRLFQVFCLPGFESDTSPAAAAHREQALRIGETYRAQFREPNPFAMSQFNRYVPRQ